MENVLKGLAIFKDFHHEMLLRLTKYFKLKSYRKDEVLLAGDSNRRELYIVVEGKVKSSLRHAVSIKGSYGEFGPGTFFGEIPLFADKPSFDTYYAAEASTMLLIDECTVQVFIEEEPELALTFFSSLLSQTIQQLRASSTFLADVVQWGEDASRRAITDELTGVYNRAFLEDALENFFHISKSNNKPLSLFMIDLDNFREINEKMGLETGNAIIHSVVTLIRGIISRYGIIARYGGDEFSILLPEADLQKAISIAEQIRLSVESYDFSSHIGGRRVPITTSIGISSFPDTATELETFKKKADAALYKAKEAGRNRVMYEA